MYNWRRISKLNFSKSFSESRYICRFFSNQSSGEIDKSRTIGISKVNVDFFNKSILDIRKLLWNINKIEIYSENFKNEKILNFENSNKTLFSMVKNYELYNILFSSLKKE